MEDVKIVWHGRNKIKKLNDFLSSMMKSDRTYYNLQIKNEYFSSFQVLTRFSFLSKVELCVDEMEVGDLADLINNLPRLRVLDSNLILQNSANSPAMLKCSSLKEISCPVAVLQRFDSLPDLTKLKLNGYHEDFEEENEPIKLIELDEILAKLPNLKELVIDQSINFNETFMKTVPFQLEKVSLRVSGGLLDLITILDHQDELTDVKLSFVYIISPWTKIRTMFSTLLRIKNLNQLKISLHILPEYSEIEFGFNLIPAIRNLSLTLKSEVNNRPESDKLELTRKLLQECPNLDSLTLDRITSVGSGAFLNGLKYLKTLQITVSQLLVSDDLFTSLNLPDLKKLVICFRVQVEDHIFNSDFLIQFLRRHRMLEEIAFDNAMIQRAVWDFMKNNLHSLKEFSLTGSTKCYGWVHGGSFFQSDNEFTVDVSRGFSSDSSTLIKAKRNY
jgi:hypothetical protein